MTNIRFESFKERMMPFGFEMDRRIDQKDQGGLLGMYATEKIPQGTTLAKFPLAGRIPFSDEVDFSDCPDESIFRTIHSMARELSNPDSAYQVFFEYCGTLDERRQRSVCFFEGQDFEILQRMNPLLATVASVSRQTFDLIVEKVSGRDASLDVDNIKLAAIIHRERCWSWGFFPGMDLFNHNTKSLLELKKVTIDGEDFVTYTAPRDIEAGEEIRITYGKKDIFDFATSYDFFDPDDFHLIGYCQRITQPIGDAFSRRVLENLKKHYTVDIFNFNGQERFRIRNEAAYFLDRGPNAKMVDLASRLAISDEKALAKGRVDEKTAARYLLYILETFKSLNKVNQIDPGKIPAKLHMYHSMLKKELTILDNNIASVRMLYG